MAPSAGPHGGHAPAALTGHRAGSSGHRPGLPLLAAQEAHDYHPAVGVGETKTAELTGEADAWQRLHGVMYRMTPEMAEVPGYFREGWTAKDAVAHIGTWMAHGAQMLRRIAAGTYREGELDIDAENERFLAAMRDVPLDTVHLQAAAARSELLRAWAELPEVTPAAEYWVRKAGPEHLAEHLPRLEAWVDELSR